MSNYPMDNFSVPVGRKINEEVAKNGSSNPVKSQTLDQKALAAEKVKNEVYRGINSRQAEDSRKRARGL